MSGGEPGQHGLDGGSLMWSPLPVEQALLFALQTARGMAHAAATIPGFVHRDLKPENVLVGADRLSRANLPGAGVNRVRVTDFGLAAVAQETARHLDNSATSDTQHALRKTRLTHGVVGTPLYMAPEQWRGEPVTAATDIYALGCILYEMLAGRRPVDGISLIEVERAHCEGHLQPLSTDVPAMTREVVRHCLGVTPDTRYKNWEEVGKALEWAYKEASKRSAPEPEPVQALSYLTGGSMAHHCRYVSTRP